MARGGKREGAGRPKVEGRKIQFICPVDLDEWLNSMRGASSITDIIVAALYEYRSYRNAES